MNLGSHMDEIIKTPMGKPKVGLRRRASELERDDGLDDGMKGGEADVRKDIVKYSDKISKARRRLEISASNKETVDELNEMLDNEDLNADSRNMMEQKKEDCKKLILTAGELKATKDSLSQLEQWSLPRGG